MNDIACLHEVLLMHTFRNSIAWNRRAFLQAGSAGMLGLLGNRLPHAFGQEQGGSGPTKKQLIVREAMPLNAEPALAHLVQSWVTPLEYFYVRGHAPVPKLDAAEFQISVEGLVHKPLSVRVGQLGQFRSTSVDATMICAGNRRNEFNREKKVGGVQWEAGALGNANWTGIRLSDLLKAAGVKPEARHIWFEGADQVEHPHETAPFGASIPLDKAMHDTDDAPGAMVATGMNGQPLTPEHGFPVRTVVPGYIGARSVKWLARIIVSDQPTPNHYISHAYKLITEDTDEAWSQADILYEFPLTSAVCLPAAGATLKPGRATVAGYALASGLPDRTIARVELSTDGGRTWNAAQLDKQSRPYCWRLWKADVNLSEGTTSLTVRAIDSKGAMQPRTTPWNLKGYMFNAWHSVPITVTS